MLYFIFDILLFIHLNIQAQLNILYTLSFFYETVDIALYKNKRDPCIRILYIFEYFTNFFFPNIKIQNMWKQGLGLNRQVSARRFPTAKRNALNQVILLVEHVLNIIQVTLKTLVVAIYNNLIYRLFKILIVKMF